MPPPAADRDSSPGAAAWVFVGALGTAGSWLVAILIARPFVGDPLAAIPPRETFGPAVLMATGGAAWGFLIGVSAAWRRGRGAILVGLGLAAVGAVGGGLTPVAVEAGRGVLPAEVSSALAWTVAGMLAGVLGHAWRSKTAAASWNVIEAAGWALGGAAAAAGGAFVVCLFTGFTGLLFESRIRSMLSLAAIGAGFGLVVGMGLGLLRGGPNRIPTAGVQGVGFAMVGAVGGGLSQIAVVLAFGELTPPAGYALGWAAAGVLAGLLGYTWTHWYAPNTEPEADDEPAQPPPDSETWLPREPVRRDRSRPLVARFVPHIAVSVGSLVGAAILAPSTAALALLAVGLLGLCVTATLANQERRVRDLERRFRGNGTCG